METRLSILHQAGVIDEDIYQGMLNVVTRLEHHWQLPLRHSQGEMAITHMANALMRARRKERIDALDDTLFAEVRTAECYPQLETINQDLLSFFDVELPDNELSYLLANLYALVMAAEEQ